MTKHINQALLLSMLSIFCAALLSTQVYALDEEKPSIEVVDDAKIFAKLDDEIPAVVNYFTSQSENSIVAFYEEQYGKAISSERKRGRLEKSFSHKEHQIKVIISQQNNQRQVDVLVTK